MSMVKQSTVGHGDRMPPRRWQDKDYLIEHLLRSRGPGVAVVDHSLVGYDLWALCRVVEGTGTVDEPDGFQYLVLFQLDRNLDGWFYRAIRESAGPARYTCPARLLKQSHDASATATQWRAKCREHRAKTRDRIKFIAGLKPGDKFKYDGRTVTFVEHVPSYPKIIIGTDGVGRFQCRKIHVERPD